MSEAITMQKQSLNLNQERLSNFAYPPVNRMNRKPFGGLCNPNALILGIRWRGGRITLVSCGFLKAW